MTHLPRSRRAIAGKNGYRRRSGGTLLLALALGSCSGNDSPATGTDTAAREHPISIQLHVHGSFSEGVGSIDSHSFEAQDVGVDAIWWSDHDFRISGYEHVAHFGFEDLSAPIDEDESWTSHLHRRLGDRKFLSRFGNGGKASLDFVDDPVVQGERSLKLELTAEGDAFLRNGVELGANRDTYRTSIAAGVRVEVAVWPETEGKDTRTYIQVDLSEHAPREGIALEQYRLIYVLTNETTEPERDGSTYTIPLAFEPGEWNRLVLRIGEDARRGFPFVPERDDCLYRLKFAVESRRGARATAYFDDLRIQRDVEGDRMYEVQREVLGELGRRWPGVKELQGVEISLAARHLNEFSLEPGLLDYDALSKEADEIAASSGKDPALVFRDLTMERAVESAHARGGLISYNHMYGTSMEGGRTKRTREEQLRIMLRSRAYGADILEVGYRDRGGASLRDHLWVWDRMALAGLRLVGVGVSDSHGGPKERWRGRPNNFVSWILAPSDDKADLLEGLGRGRVFFGDIERFDGTFDLSTERGWRMGEEVLTDRPSVELLVNVRDEGTRRGPRRLAVLVGGEEVFAELLTGGAGDIRVPLDLPAEQDTLLRAEIRDGAGDAVVLSNPIWILRSAGKEGLNTRRGVLDLAGVRSVHIDGTRILGARVGEDGSLELELAGSQRGGSLELDLSAWDGPFDARLVGPEGTVRSDGSRVSVSELRGAGRLRLMRAPASEAPR